MPVLSGTVTWPDGTPVRNASLDFYPYGISDSYSGSTWVGPAGHEFKGQTGASGKFSIPNACNGSTCPALVAYFTAPASPSQHALLGTCSIMLIWNNYPTLKVTPPAVVNYQIPAGSYCLGEYGNDIKYYVTNCVGYSGNGLCIGATAGDPTWQQIRQLDHN